MKHLLWFAILFCATSVGAERHAAPGPGPSTASNMSSSVCVREGVFEAAKAGEFSENPSYTDRLFASDDESGKSWSSFRYTPGIPGCFPDRGGMAWETANHSWLESMRSLPSYPNSGSPAAFLSSGWRWAKGNGP